MNSKIDLKCYKSSTANDSKFFNFMIISRLLSDHVPVLKETPWKTQCDINYLSSIIQKENNNLHGIEIKIVPFLEIIKYKTQDLLKIN